MSKKTLCGKTYYNNIYFPVKVQGYGNPIEINGNTATISLKAPIKDKQLDLKLYEPENIIISNGNFEEWDNCTPLHWEGDWMCNPGDEFLYKISQPMFHKYVGADKVSVRSIGPIKVKDTNNMSGPIEPLKNWSINTEFFPVNAGTEYNISISFLSKNGVVKYPTIIPHFNTGDEIELDENLTILSPKSKIPNNISKNSFSSSVGSNTPQEASQYEQTIEPIYGAYIAWYSNSSKLSTSTVIAISMGQTSDDIYWWEDGVKLTSKQMGASITVPTGATRAKIYIWNRTNIIQNDYISIRNPIVICEGVKIIETDKQFTINIELDSYPNGEGIRENMDSISFMNINNPRIDEIEEFITWDSSSLKGGYYDITADEVEISPFGTKNLKVGKENETITWQSWIPFTPNFTDITQEAKINSVKLIVTASSSQPNIPGKFCSISAGFENVRGNVLQPTTLETLNSKNVISPVNNIITESWVAGEEYEIDITESAKALFGSDTLSWNTLSEWYTVAVILRDNSSGDGTSRTIAGIGNSEYGEPKLKITYSYPEYIETNYTAPIKHNSAYTLDNSSFYTQSSGRIGGNISSECERMLIKFNTKEIPSNETVVSAKLTLSKVKQNIGTSITINISEPLDVWGWHSATWNKLNGVEYCIPHGHWENNTTNKIYSTKSVFPATSVNEIEEFVFNSTGLQYIQNIINGSIVDKGILIRKADDNSGNNTSFINFHTALSNTKDYRPKLTIVTNSKTYTIQNTIEYDDEPLPPGEVPAPPIQKKISLNKTEGLNYTYGTTQLLYRLKGAKNTQRYLTVSEAWLDTPEDREQNIVAIAFNGVPMEELVKGSGTGSYSNSRIWGLAIPDDWEGGESIEYALTIQRSGRGSIWAIARELSYINQTTPIKSVKEVAYTSVNPGNLIITMPVVPGGYVIDTISSAGKKLLTPSVNQTSDGKIDNIRFFSHYKSGSIPDTPSNIALEWSIPKDSGRNVGVAVSFNPN